MTIDGIIAVAGILLALAAIADPVQRRSVFLFVPIWLIGAGLLTSLFCVLFLKAADQWRLCVPGWVTYSVSVLSFMAPTVSTLVAVGKWNASRLSPRKATRLADLIDIANREGRYQEVERILRHNQKRIRLLPAEALHRFFDRPIVSKFIDSRSFLPLELLCDGGLQRSSPYRFYLYVDNVARALVLSPASPWRSAVLTEFGGYEAWSILDEERNVVQRTLTNPSWYMSSGAHSALLFSALEALRSGEWDVSYNEDGAAYAARTGISSRASCPVYLSAKMERLAIDAAASQRVDEDLYVTDLFHVFSEILRRSRFEASVWESSSANPEHPTPYSYLLHEIYSDFSRMFATGLEAALFQRNASAAVTAPPRRRRSKNAATASVGTQAEQTQPKPVSVDQQIATSWAMCFSSIASADSAVSERFRRSRLQDLLVFVLQLRYAPQECLARSVPNGQLAPWVALLLGELANTVRGLDPSALSAVQDAFEHLDIGKGYVQEGSKWLAHELGLASGRRSR